MSTSFIRSSSYDGLLAIETVTNTGESVRTRYVFQKCHDYKRFAIEAMQLNNDTNLISHTRFTIVGQPQQGEVVEVWADDTDMPIDMAKAMLNHVYPNHSFVLNHCEYSETGGVVSFDFETVN
jgi:hypothetical protein